MLVSASPVLSVMFSNDIRKSRMEEIVLHDVDTQSWLLAEVFIYTGQIPEVRMRVALKLLQVVAMYHMDVLLWLIFRDCFLSRTVAKYFP